MSAHQRVVGPFAFRSPHRFWGIAWHNGSMLKRKKDTRPPADINQLARHLVEVTTKTITEPTREELSRVMAALGRRGGRIGGKRRLETMTQEQRSAIALKAARARWSKRRKRS